MGKNSKYNLKNLIKLFFSFVKIGLFTIGGGMAMIPVIERVVVDEKKWLTEDEMIDCIAMSQAIPGIIAVSCGSYVGRKLYGFKGALAASLGVIMPSYLIIIGIVYLLGAVEENRYVAGALIGIKAAVVGSILITVIKMGKRTLKDALTWILAAAGFVMVACFRLNAVWAVLLGITAGLIAVFVFRRGGKDR